MASTPRVAGAAQIKVGTGSDGALEELGYTRNGADIADEAYWLDIPGDENGGDAGPPIEIQYIGQTARVRLELTKYDTAVADKIACRVRGGTVGQPAAAGTLVFANSYDFRVLVNSPSYPQNFTRCVPRAPIEINKGTRFAVLVLEFEAYKDGNGVLYNAVII